MSLKHNFNFCFFINQTEDDEETNLLRIQAVLTYLQQQEISLKASAKGKFCKNKNLSEEGDIISAICQLRLSAVYAICYTMYLRQTSVSERTFSLPRIPALKHKIILTRAVLE